MSVNLPNTHSSDLYIIGRRSISSANSDFSFVEGIVYFSAQLRIFVEVADMRFTFIDLRIQTLLYLLFFNLLSFGSGVVVEDFIIESKLFLSIVKLIELF